MQGGPTSSLGIEQDERLLIVISIKVLLKSEKSSRTADVSRSGRQARERASKRGVDEKGYPPLWQI